jgi:hypothetical protein
MMSSPVIKKKDELTGCIPPLFSARSTRTNQLSLFLSPAASRLRSPQPSERVIDLGSEQQLAMEVKQPRDRVLDLGSEQQLAMELLPAAMDIHDVCILAQEPFELWPQVSFCVKSTRGAAL